MPAAKQAASVGIMPILNRNIARIAATASRSAQGPTLASTGALGEPNLPQPTLGVEALAVSLENTRLIGPHWVVRGEC